MTMSTNTRPAHPHAPALGFTKRLLGRFHITGVFWYQFPYHAWTRLPGWTELPCVLFFTTFFYLTTPRIRSAIAYNLEAVLGPAGFLERRKREFRTMYKFAWCLLYRYRFVAKPHRFQSTLEGEEHWRELMKTGKGVVVVTAHVGIWEMAAQLGASQEKRRIHVVREKELDPRAQEFIQEMLSRAGEHHVTHFAGDDPALSLKLADALRNGEIVAFQGDRPRAGGRTVLASLFGRPMPLPVGPAVLARAADVPIAPVFNFYEGRYRVRAVARPPIHVARTADREADVAQAVHRIATEIEWAIRERPHQWFCFRRIWS